MWIEVPGVYGGGSDYEIKSNESESGCKTKLTNKLTNKTNVEQMEYM